VNQDDEEEESDEEEQPGSVHNVSSLSFVSIFYFLFLKKSIELN